MRLKIPNAAQIPRSLNLEFSNRASFSSSKKTK